jgi:hypothetical protein
MVILGELAVAIVFWLVFFGLLFLLNWIFDWY